MKGSRESVGRRPAWVASCVLFPCRRSRSIRLGVEGNGSASKAVLLLLLLLLLRGGEVELGVRLLLLLLPDVEDG